MAQTVVIDIEARFIDRTQGVEVASRKLDQFSKSIDKAVSTANKLNNKKIAPTVDAKDSWFLRKLDKCKARAEALGKKRTVMVLDAMDKATRKIMDVWGRAKAFVREKHQAILDLKNSGAMRALGTVKGALQSLVGRAWNITLRIKDGLTAPIRKIMGSPVGKVLSLAGLAGLGGTITSAVSQQVTQENLEAQYATMFGNKSGKGMEEGYRMAKERISELIDFAGQTPFTRQEIFQADKILQSYTGGKLNNEQNRNLVGNLAAIGGTDYASMATVMGRMYVNMAGGHGIGDSLMSLREMGVLSAEAEQNITSLADKVKSGAMTIDEAWEGVNDSFSDYNGMMQEMSNKLGNLLLGVKAFVTNNILGKIGEGLSESLSPFLQEFRTWRGTPEGKAWIANFGNGIKEGASKLASKFLSVTKAVATAWNEAFNSDESKNMSFFDKVGMMWKKLKDSFNEWWTGNGKRFTADIAEKIGKGLAEAGSGLLKGLFGLEAGEEGSISDIAGTIASSFIDGFKENFDITGVLDGMYETAKKHPLLSLFLAGSLTLKGLEKLPNFGGSGGGGGESGGAGGLIDSLNSGYLLYDNLKNHGKGSGKSIFGKSKGSSSDAWVKAGGKVNGQGGKLAKLGKLGKFGKLGGVAGLALGGLGLYSMLSSTQSGTAERREGWGDWLGGTLGGIGAGMLGGAMFGLPGMLIGGAVGGLAGSGIGKKVASKIGGGKTSAKMDMSVTAGSIKGVDKVAQKAKKQAEKSVKKKKVEGKVNVEMKAAKVSASKIGKSASKAASKALGGKGGKGATVTTTTTAKTNVTRQKGSVGGWKPSANNLGIPNSINARVRVNVTKVKGSVGGYTPSGSFRGGFYGNGVPHYGDGGFVHGGSQLAIVAEEGTPEAIIPLGAHRRQRGRELWAKAGEYLGVKQFGAGGIVGGGSIGSSGSGRVNVNVGGITIKVEGADIESALSANKDKIVMEIAEALNDALESQFNNMPASA